MTCNACVSSKTPDHPCLSKSVESDCPICNTSIFTSTSQVKGLRCGHFMHLACYKVGGAGPVGAPRNAAPWG